MWQYAQLTVSYGSRLTTGSSEWAVTWHGPDETTESNTRSYGDVVRELNRAGKEGWKLVDIAALDAGRNGHTPLERDWSLTRYTFRRSSLAPKTNRSLPPRAASRRRRPTESDSQAPRAAPLSRGRAGSHSPTTGTDQHANPQSSNVAGPRPTKPVTLVRFTVYCKPDDDPADSYTHDSRSGLGTGRFFIVREVAHLHNQADIETIESLDRLSKAPGASSGLREQIKGAIADYAANWVEDQWGATWWLTPQSLPLSQAADLFHDSADWLRDLVEHPAADALSAGSDPRISTADG